MFHKMLRKILRKMFHKMLGEILRKKRRTILGLDEMRRVKSLTREQAISKISSCVKVIRTRERTEKALAYFTTLKCE